MKLAIDAMGGDQAPAEVIHGVLESLDTLGEDSIVLVGREPAIMEHLSGRNGWQGKVEVLHADQVVNMGDPPTESVRKKRDSSITRLVELGASGEVDAVISAGNTGAYVAAGQLIMKTLPGVLRPGIAVGIPQADGVSVVIDVGANVSCRPQHLYQYAVMASVYYEKLFHKVNPRVGLLSVGAEERKGNQLVREAWKLCKADPEMNFVGNVEGRDIFSGVSDVVVCEGFVGNVMLKVVEAVVGNLVGSIREALEKEAPQLAGRMMAITDDMIKGYDYSRYGGAPLLGLRKLSIKCHGSSDRKAFKHAIQVARNLALDHLNDRIVERLSKQSG